MRALYILGAVIIVGLVVWLVLFIRAAGGFRRGE